MIYDRIQVELLILKEAESKVQISGERPTGECRGSMERFELRHCVFDLGDFMLRMRAAQISPPPMAWTDGSLSTLSDLLDGFGIVKGYGWG